MKRSEINLILKDTKAFMAGRQFVLPPWAYWTLTDWKKNKLVASEVIGRFPVIEEDEEPLYLLAPDYQRYL